MKISITWARRDDVNIDAVGGVFSREVTAQHGDGRFSGDIRSSARQTGGLVSSMSREVDNLTIFTRKHMRQERMEHVHGTAEVDIDVDVPIFRCGFYEGTDTACPPGGIDQN